MFHGGGLAHIKYVILCILYRYDAHNSYSALHMSIAFHEAFYILSMGMVIPNYALFIIHMSIGPHQLGILHTRREQDSFPINHGGLQADLKKEGLRGRRPPREIGKINSCVNSGSFLYPFPQQA